MTGGNWKGELKKEELLHSTKKNIWTHFSLTLKLIFFFPSLSTNRTILFLCMRLAGARGFPASWCCLFF